MTTATKTGKVYLNSVDRWLDTLPAADSDHFMEFADNCPSVIEITFVGTNADTSPPCVSMMGNAVSDPVLPLTSPFVYSSTYLALTLAALSKSREWR